MRSYEEMSRDVLNRVHAYNDNRAKKTAAIRKSLCAGVPAVLLLLTGIGIWHTGILTQKPDYVQNLPVPAGLETGIVTQALTAETTHSTTTIPDAFVTENHTERSTELVSVSTTEPPAAEAMVPGAVSTAVHTSKSLAPESNCQSETRTEIKTETKTETVPPDSHGNGVSEMQTEAALPQTTPSPIQTVSPVQTTQVPQTISPVLTAPVPQMTTTKTEQVPPDWLNPTEREEIEYPSSGVEYLYWNGNLYQQSIVDAAAYSIGSYLGYGSDFSGSYQNSGRKTTVYVSAESKDVLIVVYSDSSCVYLKKQQ